MILFYSGTGNSRFVAKKIASITQDECLNLFDRLKAKDTSPLTSAKPWVIVTPTYSWQIPHLVRDWLKHAKLNGSRQIYFVMTCGSDIGNAGKHAEALAKACGMQYMGCAGIVMPENYIAMFQAPEEAQARAIIGNAENAIRCAARTISGGSALPENRIGLADRLKSGTGNSLFYSLFVKADSFRVSDACIGCGLCERNCVTGNIHLENGKPVWGKACTHCMACICSCPQEAIEYGKASVGKPRYHCPESD